MILDRLSNATLYRRLGERFAAGFDYLQRDLAAMPDGRYEILGNDLFAMVQGYETKSIEQGRWEAHRRYADIQYMIGGRERMGVAALERMRSQVAYDAEKDLEFFHGGPDEGQLITVEQGSFAIFMPQDVHMPNLTLPHGSARVKKVVVKVKLD